MPRSGLVTKKPNPLLAWCKSFGTGKYFMPNILNISNFIQWYDSFYNIFQLLPQYVCLHKIVIQMLQIIITCHICEDLCAKDYGKMKCVKSHRLVHLWGPFAKDYGGMRCVKSLGLVHLWGPKMAAMIMWLSKLGSDWTCSKRHAIGQKVHTHTPWHSVALIHSWGVYDTHVTIMYACEDFTEINPGTSEWLFILFLRTFLWGPMKCPHKSKRSSQDECVFTAKSP